jgi:hypothetical protein
LIRPYAYESYESYESSQAAGARGAEVAALSPVELFYRSMVSRLLTPLTPGPHPAKLVLETNCEHHAPTGVGLWAHLLLAAQSDRAETPVVICADNWHVPDMCRTDDSPHHHIISKQNLFLDHIHQLGLNSTVFPLTLTTGATAISTWLLQFKWAVDVAHFNAHSCDTLAGCYTLARDSFQLIRPGGILTVHSRFFLMVQALRELAGEGGNTAAAQLVESDVFICLIKNSKAAGAVVASEEILMLEKQNREAHFAQLVMPIPTTSEAGGGACIETTLISPSSHILALNLIESHIDSNQVRKLVDVINAYHMHSGIGAQLTSSQLLDVYELRLLREFQCHLQYPVTRLRIDNLGEHMSNKAKQITLSELGIEDDSVWSAMMRALISSQQSRYEFFHRYHELELDPSFFHWEDFPTTRVGGSIFTALTSHTEYSRFQAAHRMGRNYLFGMVPTEFSAEHGTSFRPGR